jgi:hypothetical protein
MAKYASEPDYHPLEFQLAGLNAAGNPVFPVGEKVEIFAPGQKVANVSINELPAAAVGEVLLHFGGGRGIWLRHEAVDIPRDPPRDDGLYLTRVSDVAGRLRLIVGLSID